MKRHCYQINLQTHFGGGEVYTEFLTRALQDCACDVTLIVSSKARFWERLDMSGATVIPVDRAEDIEALLPACGAWLLTHGNLSHALAARFAQTHLLTGIAHMPLRGRDPKAFAPYHQVIPVSAYVLETLREAGLTNAYPRPLYGVARVACASDDSGASPIFSASKYDWDLRKGRDRILSLFAPTWRKLCPVRTYIPREGLTLGVVSRLTPIKQFPALFRILAPVIARHDGVNLEIFGSGGYASVRDTRRALAPLGKRVRFWGHQTDVGRVYRHIDYLLTGLPEKEALGLNVIEAQACGTPVLAVDAPPFTETVLDARTGFLYRDPRLDGGVAFDRLLTRLRSLPRRPDPLLAPDHLASFGFPAFRERIERLLQDITAMEPR